MLQAKSGRSSDHRRRALDHEKYLLWLLLDSRGGDLIRAYNAILASRRRLEASIFKGSYQGCARFRRTLEPKTLQSNKSLPCTLLEGYCSESMNTLLLD